MRPDTASEQLQLQIERLRLISDASRAFAGAVSGFEKLLDTVARRIALLAEGTCAVRLVSADGKWLDPVAFRNVEQAVEDSHRELFAGSRSPLGPGSISGQVAQSGEVLFLPRLNLETVRPAISWQGLRLLEENGVSSLLAMPLKVRDSVLGTIVVMRHGGERGAFDDQDVQFVHALADHAALAIDNARLFRDLERRVAERTAQLEAANKELEAFSYSVSHDLRSPLRAVDGYAQMLEEDYAGQLDAEGRRMLGTVRENARKMGQLIDDLLAFSRLGRQPIATVALDMTALVHAVAAELQASARAACEIEIGALPPARADSALMRQVWLNLIGNAIKYSSKRERPRVDVGGSAGPDKIVYRVKDNGAGFDMRYADKLFGVFQRLHRADEFPGTGVGLAIVQRIVARHRGRVWAEGRPGEGASFYFSLPAGEAA